MLRMEVVYSREAILMCNNFLFTYFVSIFCNETKSEVIIELDPFYEIFMMSD